MTVKAVRGFPVPHQSTRELQYRARNTKKTITNGLPHSRQLAEFFADEFDPDVDLMCSCDCSTNFQKPCLPGRAPSERVRCYKAREWQLVGRTRPILDPVHLVWPNVGSRRSCTNLNKTKNKKASLIGCLADSHLCLQTSQCLSAVALCG